MGHSCMSSRIKWQLDGVGGRGKVVEMDTREGEEEGEVGCVTEAVGKGVGVVVGGREVMGRRGGSSGGQDMSVR